MVPCARLDKSLDILPPLDLGLKMLVAAANYLLSLLCLSAFVFERSGFFVDWHFGQKIAQRTVLRFHE